MKKTIFTLAALALMAWGCSSDKEDPAPEPTPSLTETSLAAGTDERPSWPAVNFDLYEHNMYVEIQLQDTLTAYASENDLIGASIGDQIQGVAQPLSVDGKWIFPLFIGSRDTGVYITLLYYCDKLHRIFTKTEWSLFDSDLAPTGNDELHIPLFVN